MNASSAHRSVVGVVGDGINDALALAAARMLNPVIAGAAMAMSSVYVVSNSLLLRRWRRGLAPFSL
jgi:cation transport ATPase